MLDKKIVLFRDLDELKENDSKYAPITSNLVSNSSSSSSTTLHNNYSRTVSHGAAGHIESVSSSSNEQLTKPLTVSSACQTVSLGDTTNTSDGNTQTSSSPSTTTGDARANQIEESTEVIELRERVKNLMGKICDLEKERDLALDQLQSMKQFVQLKSTSVKAVDEVIEETEGSHGTLELSQVTPEPDEECQPTHPTHQQERQQQQTVCELLPTVDNVLLTSAPHQLMDSVEQTNLQVEQLIQPNATIDLLQHAQVHDEVIHDDDDDDDDDELESPIADPHTTCLPDASGDTATEKSTTVHTTPQRNELKMQPQTDEGDGDKCPTESPKPPGTSVKADTTDEQEEEKKKENDQHATQTQQATEKGENELKE